MHMKLLFINAKSREKFDEKVFVEESKILPTKLALAYSVQFKGRVMRAKELLEKNHKVTSVTQVLGCSQPRFSDDTKAILLIGSGTFHGISLSFESGLPVYVYESNKIRKISPDDVEKLEKKRKAAKLNFLHATKVGVLISNKPGQQRMKRALEIKEKFPDKKFYFFLENNIDINQFENFGLTCWVNTACPRLNYDYPIINLTEVEELAREK